MNNLIPNTLIDKAFPNERPYCIMIKSKQLEKDIKAILSNEKIIDYRCYLNKKKQIIYYVAETRDKYIVYKENIQTQDLQAYSCGKDVEL